MRLRVRPFTLLFVLLISSSQISSASTFNDMRGCIARTLKALLVDSIVANYQHSTLDFVEKETGQPFKMTVKKSLGNGLSAQVYVVESIEGLSVKTSVPDEVLVAKMAHSLAHKKKPSALATKNKALLNEFRNNQVLISQTDKLWADPVMQAKKDRWIEGRVPVCPIYKMIDTDAGVILIKPRVPGKSLKQIYEDAGGNLANIPMEMRQSARDLFDLAQAARRTVKVPGGTRNFTADLKPDNYMWVEDPKYLETYGLKKPGFVFVEMTHFAKTPRYTYDEKNMSVDEYENMFVDYVRAAGEE